MTALSESGPGAVRIRTFSAGSAEGIELHCREWEPTEGPVRGGVYLLHGLGEHIGRYDLLARALCAAGWRVRGHDYSGHGRSQGARGVLGADCDLRCEATPLVADFAAACGSAPVLLGQSMGGALAAQMVLSGCVGVRALVLASPALALPLSRAQRALLAVLERFAPDLTVDNALRPEFFSHDPAQVRAYVDDPLVHRRISARLLRWMLDAGAMARERAAHLPVPTLLLYAGDDRAVDAGGARSFRHTAAAAGALEAHEFEAAYHEIFHEAPPWRAQAFDRLLDWLDRQAGAAGSTGEG